MSHPILTDAQTRMKKTVDHTLHEFSTIHTGKASPAMVEGIMVEAYGGTQQLKACAAITRNDAHTRGIVVLGLDAPEAELSASLAIAAKYDLVKGFAVGRTIFAGPAADWMAGRMTMCASPSARVK